MDRAESEEEVNQPLSPHSSNSISTNENMSDAKKRKLTCPLSEEFESEEENSSEEDVLEDTLQHLLECPGLDAEKKAELASRYGRSKGGEDTRSSKFDMDVFRELTTKFMIEVGMNSKVVESDSFRKLFTYLNPEFKPWSREDQKRMVLKMHEEMKETIRLKLQSCPCRISFASDLWVTTCKHVYLTLTAHYVDDNWELQKKLLSFVRMRLPRGGRAIGNKLLSILREWGIETKVFSFTLDDYPARDVCVNLIRRSLRQSLEGEGKFFHMKCYSHVLNLIVEECLKLVDDSIEKLRESVTYLDARVERKKVFLDCMKEVNVEKTMILKEDFPAWWNHTYLMIKSCLHYEKAFVRMEIVDKNYIVCPTEVEWERLAYLHDFLEVFYNLSSMITENAYSTPNFYLLGVLSVREKLKEVSEDHTSFLFDMAKEMMKIFDKYCSDVCLILSMAIVLDPRFKFHYLEFTFPKIFPENEVQSRLNKVKARLTMLREEYGRQVPKPDSQDNTSSKQSENPLAKILRRKEFEDYHKSRRQCNLSNLDLYLKEGLLDTDSPLNVLEWWKTNEKKFPDLARVARDVLAIPVSTITSNSTFKIGGKIINKRRSKMFRDDPDIVEEIVTFRDWLTGHGVDFSEDLTAYFFEEDEDVLYQDEAGNMHGGHDSFEAMVLTRSWITGKTVPFSDDDTDLTSDDDEDLLFEDQATTGVDLQNGSGRDIMEEAENEMKEAANPNAGVDALMGDKEMN